MAYQNRLTLKEFDEIYKFHVKKIASKLRKSEYLSPEEYSEAGHIVSEYAESL